jgi:hypothetical protein
VIVRKFDVLLLQLISALARAQGWLERLVASLFDVDARRGVLEAVRAELPALSSSTTVV